MGVRRKNAVLLILLAVILVFVGCSQGSGGSGSAGSGSSGSGSSGGSTGGGSSGGSGSGGDSSGGGSEEPIVISWLSEDPPKEDGMLAQKYLEEKFNVRFVNHKIETSVYREKLNLLLSSGTIPDVMWGRFDIQQLYEQGVIAPIPISEIREYMPNYSKSINDFNPVLWRLQSFDGVNYGIPLYNIYGNLPRLPLYRMDWLRNIGYDHTPQTIEEMEDVFTKFTYNDPDQNGKNDTYAFSNRGKDALARTMDFVFSHFGIQPYYWRLGADGKLEFSMITEEAREGFKVLNRWYEMGLIDPEFAVHDAKAFENLFLTSRTGVLQSNVLALSYPSGVKTSKSALFEAVPTAEVVAGMLQNGYTPGITYRPFVFGIQMKDQPEKRKKVYEMLEAMATDPETHLMTYFGIEGEHYDIVDGGIVPRGDLADAEYRGRELGAGPFYNPFGDFSTPLMLTMYETTELREFREYVQQNSSGILNEVKFPIPAAADYPDLQKLQDEYFVKFIVGEVDLDQGFDNFVELWKRSGGQAVTDSANEVYAKLMNMEIR